MLELRLVLGLGLSVVTNLSAFLNAPVLFHNLRTNHDPVKRYIKTEDKKKEDKKVMLLVILR